MLEKENGFWKRKNLHRKSPFAIIGFAEHHLGKGAFRLAFKLCNISIQHAVKVCNRKKRIIRLMIAEIIK